MIRSARLLSPGHPDKTCDLIAETIVDEYLRRDPATRLRVHVMGGKGALFVNGVVSSKADFDVGAIASRMAGSLGARVSVEPFVALEAIGSAHQIEQLRYDGLVQVLGYATRETPNLIPSVVALARVAAQQLETLRIQDADWFWLEPAFQVTAVERAPGIGTLSVSCAHGDRPVDAVRESIISVLQPLVPQWDVEVNHQGACTEWSFDQDIGSSGAPDEPYGASLLFRDSLAGLDPYHPRKFGSWLARALARQALARSGAQAVLVRAAYEPKENAPMAFSVRDERGRDLAQPGDRDLLRDLSLANSLRNGISADAMRWGFAGVEGFGWEQ